MYEHYVNVTGNELILVNQYCLIVLLLSNKKGNKVDRIFFCTGIVNMSAIFLLERTGCIDNVLNSVTISRRK